MHPIGWLRHKGKGKSRRITFRRDGSIFVGLKRARCRSYPRDSALQASLAARRRVQELWVAAIHSSTRPYSVEVFLMRNLLLGLAVLAATACASGALAQSKPLPPASSDVMPPVELTITMDGDKPRCAPAELKLPANTNVELHIVSEAADPVTVTAPGQFENANVLHADGDLVHVASEKGYLVKQHGKGVLRIRTLKPGQETYACTSNRNQKAPFEGKLVLTPPAG